MLKITSFLFAIVSTFFSNCKKDRTDSNTNTNYVIATPILTPPNPPLNTNLELIAFGTLSEARYHMIAGVAGDKILFAGGFYIRKIIVDGEVEYVRFNSTRVDIYDTTLHTWTTAELGRYYYGDMTAVTCGDKIFFPGGFDTSNYSATSTIDIYDASANSWSSANLSEARYNLATASVGNRVFFAGGNNHTGVSNTVDIYDAVNNTWSTASLSEARSVLTAASVGNKIFFAGGNNGSSISGRVDIYDLSTNTWSTSSLSGARELPAAVSLGDKVFFAGGNTGTGPSDKVDIYDDSTQRWSVANVNFYSSFFDAVSLNNRILFFTLVNAHWVNVYNTSNNSWSLAYLDQRIINPAVVAVGNNVYIAGGMLDDGTQSQTRNVWRIQF